MTGEAGSAAATTGKVGSAATTRGKAGSAASTTGEADGEGSDGGSGSGGGCHNDDDGSRENDDGGYHDDDDNGYRDSNPSPLLPGDHGMDFVRRRPRRGVATATGGACGCGPRPGLRLGHVALPASRIASPNIVPRGPPHPLLRPVQKKNI
uniref:Uncharacterized protein n=1 Tax=Oryza nivara TaxID=4536 RepID=A0A0E0HR67_ORYNI